MATGLPVVAAASPGIRQILRDGPGSGGLVVPQESPGELASELARLLGDEALRAELGRRARLRAEAFSLDAVGSELREFLRRRGARL
jgi:glycosyltransferase involved in cell wall biosynthesis